MERSEIVQKLNEYNISVFQRRVLLATLSIPKGKTATYKQVAQKAGYPNAYRAVGSVMKMNPLAPHIPCHRVIKSSGKLGNYSAGGTNVKMKMLKSERAI